MEIEVNHRCDVKGQGLREKQASNDCDSQRTASFTTYTSAECDRKGSQECGHSGHHDRAKALETAPVDRIFRA
jgi:hypothetical protein